MDHPGVQRALLACGVVGPQLFVLVFSIDGATRPGYSAYRHFVSALSLGDRGWVQVANFLVLGALLLVASVGWRRALAPGRASRAAPALLAVVGIGFLVAGVFPTDPVLGYPPGSVAPASYSVSSSLHGLGALLVFPGIAAAAFVFARRARADAQPRWRGASIAAGATVLAFFVAGSVVATMATSGRLADAPAGLLQRVAAFAGLGWIAAVSWKLRG